MNLLRKPALGLDISDRSVEAVAVLRVGTRATLVSYGESPLPPGMVQNGEIVDAEGLAMTVRKLLRDRMTPPLPKGTVKVALALPESQVYMHVFEVPRLADDRELGASLAREADGYFPYPHDELAASHAVIAQRPDTKDVYYAAVRKTVLEAYLHLCRSIGLVPVALEAESSAIARAVLDKASPSPVALIDIGARGTDISVYDRDGIHFSETLPEAGEAFTAAVAGAGGLSSEQAETMKKEHGLSGGTGGKEERALRSAVDAICAGVREAIAYYEEKSGRKIGNVLVCGGGARLPGLLARAAESFGSGRIVEAADPWKSLQPSPELEQAGLRTRGVLLTMALGLGLRAANVRKFQELNFLSAASKIAVSGAKGASRSGIRRGVLIALAAAVIAGGGFLGWKRFGARRASPSVGGVMQVSPVDVAVAVTMGSVFSAENGVLAGRPLDVSYAVAKTVPHAAHAVDGQAKGTLDIVNDTGTARALVASTRLLSPDGVQFRLDRAAKVPAHGRVQATVTADQAGAAGDVAAGRFTIPGLAPALQKSLYGESTQPMRGGETFAGDPYTEEERLHDENGLRQAALDEALQNALSAAGTNAVALGDLIDLPDFRAEGLPPVGVPTGEFESRARGKAKAYVLEHSQVQQLLTEALAAKLGPAEDASGYRFENRSFQVADFDAGTGMARLTIRATAVRSGS